MAENIRSGRRRRGESSAHNPIACESCRTKKRRCSHDPSQCHYPEQNKRGLPSGYVNKLEARLAETEAALFHILSQVDGADSQTTSLAADEISSPPSSSSIPGQNSKAERVREWDRLPLQTVGDIRLWYRSKAVQCCGHVAADLPSRASQDTPGDQPVGELTGAHAGRSAQSSQPATAVPGAIITVESPKPDSSRANELSRSQYSLYF
ncbi:hypothetical protein ACRE_063920 [Hapsidospora chrysogenum ATCC 11550]|uniref:Zn(2)-C6 fungal-type domain-containing protein n=1 Tax=Hapsidospora chrysogenum (strain ATCC 11550 / CBS 779.69 / DSM 880 / IAM 14645 / JCM 23072 / IMI 49137) TaxID=857340 RepID=A0A086T0H8_HAPC1|nr:hypothetical protein ACRE_063920 [Hapsidospora chrysogenum ATCC 11550]